MSGTISLDDAMPASGLDPGAAPDWRSVAPSSARLSFATPQFSHPTIQLHSQRARLVPLPGV
jgi:hypothetical protein